MRINFRRYFPGVDRGIQQRSSRKKTQTIERDACFVIIDATNNGISSTNSLNAQSISEITHESLRCDIRIDVSAGIGSSLGFRSADEAFVK